MDLFQDFVVGLRYPDICIPSDATILNASLTLTSDEADDVPTSALIWVEMNGDAPTFSADSPIAGRTRSDFVVEWADIPAWQVGDTETSPDLSTLIEELIASPQWDPDGDGCGTVVLILEGTGDREARSFDNPDPAPPVFEVTYQP